MKKIIISIILAASLGGCLQAQDTVWRKPAPLDNYFYNNWLDTTKRYTLAWDGGNGSVVAKRFIAKDTLQVYGIAAMMTNPWALDFSPSSYYPTLQAYLQATYPEDPTMEHCGEQLILYQYHGNASTVMQQLGDSLSIHYLYTPVTHWLLSNTAPNNYFDQYPKPVFERYFSEPQTVYDTFYTGYTQSHFRLVMYIEPTGDTSYYSRRFRPELLCYIFTGYYPEIPCNGTGYEEYKALLKSTDPYTPATWVFPPADTDFSLFIFPIIAPPDTTVNPSDTIIDPIDTIVSGDIIVRPGNIIVIAPGDIIVIGGDTIVNTGDTLTVTLGDTVVISGHPVVINPGDTLTVNPGDTLFVNSDGSITVNPGGTIVVSSGGGGTPGIGIQTNDLLYRYTSVQPNPATDKVRVTSSFGLTRIEAYDLRGRLLFETPASGLKADLDVSSWPRGTYLLRISTPAGPTTKKLLVQ